MNREIYKSFKDNCGFGLIASIDNKATHKNLEDAITALSRMMHRGAIAADGKSGDGSGLLFSMPKEFFRKVAKEEGVDLPETFAVGVIFATKEEQKSIVEEYCAKNDLKVSLWRKVPINKEALGDLALKSLPKIYHAFIVPNSIIAIKRFEELLYLSRKEIENHMAKEDKNFYIPTFSSKKIAYKGLLMPNHIKEFYPDLNDKDFKISFALFHQRFSTNTLPEWRLAQPFRFIAHNGEINSVEANRINALIKSESIKSSVFTQEELDRILPIVRFDESDSSSLDRMIEFLIMNGMDFFKTVRALIPMPWQNAPSLDSELKAFYEYFSTRFEAWDGPAAVSVTDGRYIGVVLDRNGLRPAKYIITKDNRILIASEYGVLETPEENIKERGKLQSGQMIGIDTKFGVVLKSHEIDEYLKSSNPYTKWLNENMIYLQEYIENPYSIDEHIEVEEFAKKQRYAGITKEAINLFIKPLINEGKEPTGSMGDDTPLACFSNYPFRSFNDFFRQKFAQVTNPPIDSLREKIVMSLNTGFGEIHNILDEGPEYAKRIKATSPILTQSKLTILKEFGDESSPKYESYYKNKSYDVTFKENLKASLEELTDKIVEDVKNDGIRIIFLDDSKVSKELKTIPMAMVIGRLHKKLIDAKVRHLTSIVALSSEVITAHDAAVFIAYGATAIYPYMLFKTVCQIAAKEELDRDDALFKVHSALNKGILKIMSKMGISTIASYRNSALFDVIGLKKELVDECFIGSKVTLSGLDYDDIEEKVKRRHQEAFKDESIISGGVFKFKKNEEVHEYTPTLTKAFTRAVESEDYSEYKKFKELVENREPIYIRDFLEIKSDRKPISIDEVEPAEVIVKRFVGAAMSIGALSPEAHEDIAEALNTIGAKSNSGEGGEDKRRDKTIKRSKIRQVASGRFGVTPEYLVNAEEIQIKVAQGAKPGEGGQLPGFKVTTYIAKLRHTTPGKTLISPPPHHDIYSIEDLAQLIFDLKQINPKAKISVKLVSTIGVGTIAAGVAKAYADHIVISGSEGGTGAAPITSIRHAGNPWELGIIEGHNALKANHLREFVSLETDGAIKAGRDVIIAALLGAEYYGFGTSLMMAVRCIFCRSCQTNKCPVGITTQADEYRAKYKGTVQKIINYMMYLAQDIREYLASMGYKSMQELIGRNDLLRVKDIPLAKKFDFSMLFDRVEGVDTKQKENIPFDKNEFELELLEKVRDTIKNPNHKSVVMAKISNLNRSFGARISGEIAKYYGDEGLEDDSIIFNLTGTAGQSFGVFLSKGVTLNLEGVANDYVGKGMAGGKIIIKTPKGVGAGNTCLYGATAGKLFVSGAVGERFAVRNSGAVAIVEGTGDHPCEYMTGGEVIILGKTGINFGAGMTGGLAFVYDKEHNFVDKINPELIEIRRIDIDDNEKPKLYLKKRLIEYLNATNSEVAKYILDNFRSEVRHFWLVTPKDNRPPLNPNEMD